MDSALLDPLAPTVKTRESRFYHGRKPDLPDRFPQIAPLTDDNGLRDGNSTFLRERHQRALIMGKVNSLNIGKRESHKTIKLRSGPGEDRQGHIVTGNKDAMPSPTDLLTHPVHKGLRISFP
jgi:hypothetical protein